MNERDFETHRRQALSRLATIQLLIPGSGRESAEMWARLLRGEAERAEEVFALAVKTPLPGPWQ